VLVPGTPHLAAIAAATLSARHPPLPRVETRGWNIRKSACAD
jgi:hypothetical protein